MRERERDRQGQRERNNEWKLQNLLAYSQRLRHNLDFCTHCYLYLKPPSSSFSGRTLLMVQDPVQMSPSPWSLSMPPWQRAGAVSPLSTAHSQQPAYLPHCRLFPASIPSAENAFLTKSQYPRPRVHRMWKFPKHCFPLLTAMHTNIFYYSLFSSIFKICQWIH